ncbi:hypothetical protein [Streptomyces echinatus]|uniref:Uncharacterized protein n=1 Tax=Streptomyces echinatus TaxID=67293 RepID=A0A7W9UQ55_9ACTN|nr:hypothetical protein [Streptomyces echinatus]MBB5926159.1 hypothetical protein [Streptomyces echinatus]
MATNPYFTTPYTPTRPRMFNTSVAKVIWTLVPLVSLGLAAAVPFVVAAVKGVVKPWLAITYVVGELVIFGSVFLISPKDGDAGAPFAGLLLILMMITAATHTALLDNEKINVGK